MKQLIKLFGIIAVTAVMLFNFMACKDGGGSNSLPIMDQRYEPVPFEGGIPDEELEGEDWDPIVKKLVLMAYDEDSYHYVFLMGHVKNLPLSNQQTFGYNGVTPITVSFSISQFTEETVTESLTNALMNSLSSSSTVIKSLNASTSHTIKWENKATASAGLGPFVKAEVSASLGGEHNVQAGWEKTWNDTNSETSARSTSNTYETAIAKSTGETDTLLATIGNNNEAPGLYRWALYSTSDVFFVLQIDRNKTQVINAYSFISAREGTYAWWLDHDPSPSGNFERTGTGDLLTIPDVNIDKLPTPTKPLGEVNIPPPATEYDFTERANTNVGGISIPADIAAVKFIGDPSKTYSMYINIEPRNTNNGLTITLEDMNFKPILLSVGMTAINGASALSGLHNVIIEVIGDCTISGGDPVAIGMGLNGGDAINVGNNNLILRGTGNLTLTGGKGTNATTLGTGNNGGNGGRGIYSGKTVIFETEGLINITGGNAGYGSAYNRAQPYTTAGHGGHGGSGLVGLDRVSFKDAKGNITIRGGDGANGGNGFTGTINATNTEDLLFYNNYLIFFIAGAGGNGAHALVTADEIPSDYLLSPPMLNRGSAGNGGTANYVSTKRDGIEGQLRSETENLLYSWEIED